MTLVKQAVAVLELAVGRRRRRAIYLSDTQDDSTSGLIAQPEVSGSSPAEGSPTPASSGTGDPYASPTPTVAVATPVTRGG